MTTTTVTVTIPAATFARDADRHARYAACLASEAAGYYAAALRFAPDVPADWRTPGGAGVATVVRLIEQDAREAKRDAREAREHARDAANATTATDAARAEHMAEVHAKSAKIHAETTARYLGYLPR